MDKIVIKPAHYRNGSFEVIDEMLLAFGAQRVYDYCVINAWKYRARAPYKGNPEQDMAKADYYMVLANQIMRANPGTFIDYINLIKEDRGTNEKQI